MAVISPGSLPADDGRPIFDGTHLPGGPWRTYRNRQTVDAVFVRGPFLVRRPSDGMLIEASDRWVVIDQSTGDPTLMSQAIFSATYEAAG